MFKKIILSVGLYFITIVSPNVLLADEVVGEIINVNYRDKVAFVDLGNESLSKGDVLVVEDGSRKIYLEAIDVNDAVTRLGPSNNPDFPCDSDDFKEVMVGSSAKRAWAKPQVKEPVAAPPTNPSPVTVNITTDAPVAKLSEGITQMPIIDPQVLTKPNIANETIQSLDARLDKMVESNVKLFNALTELLNEKKTWESSTVTVRNDLQSQQAKVQELAFQNADLKKQIADAKIETAGAVADREKYKQQAEDLRGKVDQLKKQLDHLTQIVDEQIKNVSP